MALVRRLVELGRSARADSGVKTRQPLSRALVSAPGFDDAARRAARRDRRRAQRRRGAPVPSAAGIPGGHDGEGELPHTRQAVRQGGAGRGHGHRGRGRRGAQARPARDRHRLRHRRRRADHPRPRRSRHHRDAPRGLGGGQPTPVPPSRWTCTSRRNCAGPARPGRDPPIQEARKSSGLEVADRIVLRYEAAAGETRPRWPSTAWSPTRCWPPTSHGRTVLARCRAVHRRVARPPLLAPQGLSGPAGYFRRRRRCRADANERAGPPVDGQACVSFQRAASSRVNGEDAGKAGEAGLDVARENGTAGLGGVCGDDQVMSAAWSSGSADMGD